MGAAYAKDREDVSSGSMANDLLTSIFNRPNPVVGMVHLDPLPGSSRWDGNWQRVLDHAVRDAKALKKGGADGAVIENYGDLPFTKGAVEPACVAAMTAALKACVDATGMVFGINVLRNDPSAALGIALAGGGRFIRTNVHTGAVVTDQGLLEGRAAETMRDRARLRGESIAVFADVLVKHAVPLGERDPRRAARDAVLRGGADAVLVTGDATGHHADLREVAIVRDAVPESPVLVASGVKSKDLALIAALADGVIVGTSLKRGGRTSNAVDATRVRAMVKTARKAWKR
ncbi:MAG: BtpA/SgcQ family protein [Planctomycetota bacterium]|jgi:membrane complex biogenesis BtpA family protein